MIIHLSRSGARKSYFESYFASELHQEKKEERIPQIPTKLFAQYRDVQRSPNLSHRKNNVFFFLSFFLKLIDLTPCTIKRRSRTSNTFVHVVLIYTLILSSLLILFFPFFF